MSRFRHIESEQLFLLRNHIRPLLWNRDPSLSVTAIFSALDNGPGDVHEPPCRRMNPGGVCALDAWIAGGASQHIPLSNKCFRDRTAGR